MKTKVVQHDNYHDDFYDYHDNYNDDYYDYHDNYHDDYHNENHDYPDLLKPATAATGGRVKKANVCVKLWLAGIYFLVHAIFVACKLWIWQQFNFLACQF